MVSMLKILLLDIIINNKGYIMYIELIDLLLSGLAFILIGTLLPFKLDR